MGCLTPVLLYNDSLDQIKNDPTFTRRPYDTIISDTTIKKGGDDVYLKFYHKTWFDRLLTKVGLYRNPKENQCRGSSSFAQVLPTQHADITPGSSCYW